MKLPVKFIRKIGGSTGLASGNTFEEAITQGLCELFERHCYSQVKYNRICVPTIDLNTIDNPKIKQQIAFYNRHDIEVKIKDFSLGTRFPVVAVLFINHRIKNSPNRLKRDLFALRVNPGAAFDIEDAAMRCFTEKRQILDIDDYNASRLIEDTIWKHWVSALGKSYKRFSSLHSDFRKYLTDSDLSFLLDESSELISFDTLKNAFPRHFDFSSDVKYLLDLCQREKKEVIVINTQHPKINFPSVWVVVPEMMWAGDKVKNGRSIFLKYSLEDSWFEDADCVNALIKKAEDYLSENLFYTNIETIFGTEISLFRILAISNLKIMNFGEALNYFAAAKELENVNIYDEIIERLKEADNKDLKAQAAAMKNPFVHGWTFKEKAINRIVIPNEVNRILHCLQKR